MIVFRSSFFLLVTSGGAGAGLEPGKSRALTASQDWGGSCSCQQPPGRNTATGAAAGKDGTTGRGIPSSGARWLLVGSFQVHSSTLQGSVPSAACMNSACNVVTYMRLHTWRPTLLHCAMYLFFGFWSLTGM